MANCFGRTEKYIGVNTTATQCITHILLAAIKTLPRKGATSTFGLISLLSSFAFYYCRPYFSFLFALASATHLL